MKRYVYSFCALAWLMASSCAMAALFSVFSIVEGVENHDPGLALWLPCLALCHIGLGLFLRRERSIRSVIWFCAAFFVVQTAAVFAVYGFFSSLVGTLAALCMWLYSYFACYDLNVKMPTAEKLTKGFDLCSLVLIFLLFFCSVNKLSLSMALPLALSTLFCLFALIIIRGGEQRKLRSLFISGGVVLAFGLLAAAFVAVASGGIKRLLAIAVEAFYALLRFVLRAINAFFLFIASLFPDREYELEPPPVQENAGLGDAPDLSFEILDPELVMAVTICLGLLVAAAFLVYRLIKGKRRIVSVSAGGERGLRRSRTGLGAALARTFARLWEKLRFAAVYLSAHNTAPGLFMQLEKRSRQKLRGRRKSESCREFLQRAEIVYPWAMPELRRLADAMDCLCFGGGVGPGPAEIIKMRRKIFGGDKAHDDVKDAK